MDNLENNIALVKEYIATLATRDASIKSFRADFQFSAVDLEAHLADCRKALDNASTEDQAEAELAYDKAKLTLMKASKKALKKGSQKIRDSFKKALATSTPEVKVLIGVAPTARVSAKALAQGLYRLEAALTEQTEKVAQTEKTPSAIEENTTPVTKTKPIGTSMDNLFSTLLAQVETIRAEVAAQKAVKLTELKAEVTAEVDAATAAYKVQCQKEADDALTAARTKNSATLEEYKVTAEANAALKVQGILEGRLVSDLSAELATFRATSEGDAESIKEEIYLEVNAALESTLNKEQDLLAAAQLEVDEDIDLLIEKVLNHQPEPTPPTPTKPEETFEANAVPTTVIEKVAQTEKTPSAIEENTTPVTKTENAPTEQVNEIQSEHREDESISIEPEAIEVVGRVPVEKEVAEEDSDEVSETSTETEKSEPAEGSEGRVDLPALIERLKEICIEHEESKDITCRFIISACSDAVEASEDVATEDMPTNEDLFEFAHSLQGETFGELTEIIPTAFAQVANKGISTFGSFLYNVQYKIEDLINAERMGK